MTDCIFCKIINKEIPSYPVYEDEEVYAFLDMTQTTKGHTLLVPKKHVTDIFEYDAQLAETVFSRVPKIAKAMEKAFPEMAGLNVVNNNREVAYQSVFHSHVHLLPRYSKQDDFKMTFADNSAMYPPEEMTKIADAINEQVN
ncbi:HIT family protein [Vagococcus acidifermentans]|uniref:HIT family protein n=1 Tax=Vagococcus acidifermentans TaxID=564710 RepID=A0A430AP64_9ENTE|nr:HIT family protein [Vagococcus acidifermentans]RSU09763.1 HIT family protein [Vagococcus acidifermentans]